MFIVTEDDALNLISQNASIIKIQIEPNFISKLQLYMTGSITKGVEIFGIGLVEIRGMGFLFKYHKIINNAISNGYRVFVIKEGFYFGKGNWILEFKKNSF